MVGGRDIAIGFRIARSDGALAATSTIGRASIESTAGKARTTTVSDAGRDAEVGSAPIGEACHTRRPA